jgi:hypothetical protein
MPGTPLSLDNARRLVEGYVEHYNNIRLNSAVGYITPKECSPGVRRRSTPRGIGSWRRRENSVRFVGSRLREKARALVSGQFRVTDEVYYCRGVSSRSSSASECWSLDMIRELPDARRYCAW